MDVDGSDVEVWLYDLSRGMAQQMSMPLTGIQIDGIWHTSVVVFGFEVFFGQGISIVRPGSSHHGQPLRRLPMGRTEIDQDTVSLWLESAMQTYTAESYHLLEFNCNTFSADFVSFLNGATLPPYITNLPAEFLATPFGQSLRPMIDSMFRPRTTNGLAPAQPAPDAGAAVQALLPPPSTTNTPAEPAAAAAAEQDMPSVASLTSNFSNATTPARVAAILRNHRRPLTVILFAVTGTAEADKLIRVFEGLSIGYKADGRRVEFVLADLTQMNRFAGSSDGRHVAQEEAEAEAAGRPAPSETKWDEGLAAELEELAGWSVLPASATVAFYLPSTTQGAPDYLVDLAELSSSLQVQEDALKTTLAEAVGEAYPALHPHACFSFPLLAHLQRRDPPFPNAPPPLPGLEKYPMLPSYTPNLMRPNLSALEAKLKKLVADLPESKEPWKGTKLPEALRVFCDLIHRVGELFERAGKPNCPQLFAREGDPGQNKATMRKSIDASKALMEALPFADWFPVLDIWRLALPMASLGGTSSPSVINPAAMTFVRPSESWQIGEMWAKEVLPLIDAKLASSQTRFNRGTDKGFVGVLTKLFGNASLIPPCWAIMAGTADASAHEDKSAPSSEEQDRRHRIGLAKVIAAGMDLYEWAEASSPSARAIAADVTLHLVRQWDSSRGQKELAPMLQARANGQKIKDVNDADFEVEILDALLRCLAFSRDDARAPFTQELPAELNPRLRVLAETRDMRTQFNSLDVTGLPKLRKLFEAFGLLYYLSPSWEVLVDRLDDLQVEAIWAGWFHWLQLHNRELVDPEHKKDRAVKAVEHEGPPDPKRIDTSADVREAWALLIELIQLCQLHGRHSREGDD